MSCPDPFPSAPTPAFKKTPFLSKQGKKKKTQTRIKNWSKSPQSRERTGVGNCSLLVAHREQGELSCGFPHTEMIFVCVWGSPPSQQCHSPETSLLHSQTLGVGKVQTTSVQKNWNDFCCVDDTFGVLRDSFGRWGGDLPLVPLSHETGWVYNQRKGSQSFFFFKGAVMLVDWERSGQRFCPKKSSFNKTLCVCIHTKSYWFQWSFPWKTKLNFVHSRKILP